jgi:uncharacterized repeat protein (TIGR03803 family)
MSWLGSRSTPILSAMRPRSWPGWLGGLLPLITLAGWGSASDAQTYNVLYNFAGNNGLPGISDGDNPYGSPMAIGSTLYGMTYGGGLGDRGTVFAFNLSGDQETVLHSFLAGNDGGEPYGSLLQSGSTLYGLTSYGTLFGLNTTNDSESVLHSFDVMGGGSVPFASLIQSGTILYGTTGEGGTNGHGTIFAYDTTTDTENVLYSFGPAPDGESLQSNLVQSGSTLYGMTVIGGTSGVGTIFAYNLATNSESVVHSFAGQPTDGSIPQFASLTLSGNKLYGVTGDGGTYDDGTIFSYDISTGAYQVLFSFNGKDGDDPTGALVAVGSMLYGVSGFNGGPGDVFAFDTEKGSESVLHTFDTEDGYEPDGGLTLVGSTLYGMTILGGTYGDGVIFSITVPEPATFSLLAITGGCLLLRRRR